MSFPKLLVWLLLPLLAACPKLPQPFEHDQANPLLVLDGRGGVFFDLDPTAPRPFALALKAALMKQDVPVFMEKPPAEALALRLKLRPGPERGGTREIEFFWELLDREGLAVGHHDQKARVLSDDWQKGAQALMKRLADDAAPALAALMPVEDGTKPASPDAVKKIAIFIPPVEGAPGDGNDALMRAMRLALSANGMSLLEQPQPGAYQLKGKVSLGRSDPKGDKLHLEWTLQDAKGGEMASLDQDGMVAKGLLDKPWGSLASEIVAGTAIELAGLLKEAAQTQDRR